MLYSFFGRWTYEKNFNDSCYSGTFSFISVGTNIEICSMDGLEGLDPEVLEQITSMSVETGIDFDNLVAVNDILSTLPEEQFAEITEELGDLIAEGFADEINQTLNDLSEIEGGLDNFFNFDSLDECLAAGASNCEATAAAIGDEG